jgi:prepilin-type N-terminal cleavage/methylation domain-containing protein
MTRSSATVVRPAVGETRRRCREAVRRGGMTLVELMVTMVVISILASLSLAGMVSARNRAKASRTATTIRKISELILPYYEQYETRRPTITNSSALAALPNGRTLLADAKQIAIRRLMTLELPERPADFTGAFDTTSGVPQPLYPTKTYAGTVTVQFRDMPPVTRRYYQIIRAAAVALPSSPELLHLIVTRGPVADPEVVAHFRDDEVRDTNRNGLPEFVDGWNRPIAFRRWPIGFLSPAQPIDGTLRNIDPVLSSNGHRLVPLIFSAGPDQAYDIVSDVPDARGNPLSYYDINYDPFAISASSPAAPPLGMAPQSPAIGGSVVLTPVPGAAGSGSPLVFQATRMRSGASIAAMAFQTVGSERDTGSADNESAPNGILESRDNIHNHDMTR